MERMRTTVSFLSLVKPIKMGWVASDIFPMQCNTELGNIVGLNSTATDYQYPAIGN